MLATKPTHKGFRIGLTAARVRRTRTPRLSARAREPSVSPFATTMISSAGGAQAIIDDRQTSKASPPLYTGTTTETDGRLRDSLSASTGSKILER